MAVVRKDKLQSGYNGNLESVKIHNNAGTATVDATNGVFVFVDGLMTGEREVKKGFLGATADIDKDVLLVHNAEVMYDERKYKLSDYVIKADKVARAYHLNNGDIISLTVDLFAETVAVGDVLSVKVDGKLGKNTGSPKVAFKVIEDCGYELDETMKAFAVEVIRP